MKMTIKKNIDDYIVQKIDNIIYVNMLAYEEYKEKPKKKIIIKKKS